MYSSDKITNGRLEDKVWEKVVFPDDGIPTSIITSGFLNLSFESLRVLILSSDNVSKLRRPFIKL